VDLEGVDGMLSGGSSGGESEREKVRLNCEHPRHVTVASPGIPGPSPPRYQMPAIFPRAGPPPRLGWQESRWITTFLSLIISIACAGHLHRST
jgi:hypothetical protein